MMPDTMIPFRDLPEARQLALREAWAEDMARQARTCELSEKIARFAAWLAPQGISFGPEDLPKRR
jgi:hypothetical protein